MSSGRPTRRTGVRGGVELHTLPQETPGLRSPQHRGVDESRWDRVDRDPLRPELEGERLGEADDPGLRGDVVGHEGLPPVCARGRDGHDAPPPRLDHVGDHRLADVEGAREVDREDPLPGLGRDREERVEAVEAGTRDEDGGSAEPGTHFGQTGVDGRPIGDVDREAHRAVGRGRTCGDIRSRRRRGVAVPIEHGDGMSVDGEPLGDREADARSTARDDGDPRCARTGGAHRIASSPWSVVRCMSRGDAGS